MPHRRKSDLLKEIRKQKRKEEREKAAKLFDDQVVTLLNSHFPKDLTRLIVGFCPGKTVSSRILTEDHFLNEGLNKITGKLLTISETIVLFLRCHHSTERDGHFVLIHVDVLYHYLPLLTVFVFGFGLQHFCLVCLTEEDDINSHQNCLSDVQYRFRGSNYRIEHGKMIFQNHSLTFGSVELPDMDEIRTDFFRFFHPSSSISLDISLW